MVLMRLPVSSAALLCRAVVRLMLREWLVALIRRDALLWRSVEAEATGYYRAGLERDGESASRPRLYARGLGRDGESVPRPRPFVRGLERGGEPVASDKAGG